MGQILQDILTGMGSLVDLRGLSGREGKTKFFAIKTSSPKDDAKALRGDVEKIGKDMRKAMLTYHVVEREEEAISSHP